MPVKRKNRHGKTEWFGRVKLPDGRRKEKKFPTKARAVEWETLVRRKLLECSNRTTMVSLHSLMTRHLDAMEAKGAAKGTLADKRLCFKELLAWPGVDPVMDAGALEFDRVRAWLDRVAENRSRNRANTFRKHIMRLWSWGRRAWLVEGECPWDVEPYKVDRAEKYVPQESDFWKVYSVAHIVPRPHYETCGAADEEPHRKRMLLTFLHTAGRRGEVFNLRWTDVDFAMARVRLWTRKRTSGLEGDWIPMTGQLAEALHEQRLETGFGEFVFINPRTQKPYAYAQGFMAKICKRAGVEPFGFHAIRHLSASILAQSGVDLPTIQLILRHRSVTTTARYVHSLTDASKAVEQAFGGKVLEMKKASGV